MPSQERPWWPYRGSPRRPAPAHRRDRCVHTSSGVAAVLPPPSGSQAANSGVQPGQVLGKQRGAGRGCGRLGAQAGWVAWGVGGGSREVPWLLRSSGPPRHPRASPKRLFQPPAWGHVRARAANPGAGVAASGRQSVWKGVPGPVSGRSFYSGWMFTGWILGASAGRPGGGGRWAPSAWAAAGTGEPGRALRPSPGPGSRVPRGPRRNPAASVPAQLGPPTPRGPR